MKTILFLLPLAFTQITQCLYRQEIPIDKRHAAEQRMMNDVDTHMLISRCYSCIEQARLYPVFQEMGKEDIIQKCISKKNALIQLTSSLNNPSVACVSGDLYQAGLIYTHDKEYAKADECFAASSEPEAYYMRAKLILDRSQELNDLEKAEKFLEKSSLLGYSKATSALDLLKQHKQLQEQVMVSSEVEQLKQQEPLCEQLQLQLSPLELFLEKPISKSTVRKLLKQWPAQEDRAWVRQVLASEQVQQSELFAHVIGQLLALIQSRPTPDELLLCDLIEAVEKHAHKDKTKRDKQAILQLIASDTWKQLMTISEQSYEIAISLMIATEMIGFYYETPTLLDDAIELHKRVYSCHKKRVNSLVDMYLVQAALYKKIKSHENVIRCFELAAQEDPRYYWDVGSYISNTIDSITTIDKQELLDKSLAALTLYADTVKNIPHDRLAYVLKYTGHGISLAHSNARTQANHTKALEYAQRLLEQVESDIALCREREIIEADTLKPLTDLRLEAAAACLRGAMASEQVSDTCSDWLDILIKGKSNLIVNSSIILFNSKQWDLARTALTSIINGGYITQKYEIDFARYLLGLIEFQHGAIDAALDIFTKIENLDIMKVNIEHASLIEKAVSALVTRVEKIMAKQHQDLTSRDLDACWLLGKLTLSNKKNHVLLSKVAPALHALMFGVKHGSVESQLTLWLHTNDTQLETWQKQFTNLLEMLPRLARREYPIFSNDSDEKIAAYTKRIVTYLLNLKSEHHVMLAYIAPLYRHNYEELFRLIISTGAINDYCCPETNYSLRCDAYSELCAYLKAYCQSRLAQAEHLLEEERGDVQKALLLQWNMDLMHIDSDIQRDPLWLSKKIEAVYGNCAQWHKKIEFTDAMTKFYERIMLEYLSDNEELNLGQWNSMLETLVKTTKDDAHRLCGLIMLCKRAKGELKNQQLRLLCDYVATHPVRGIYSTVGVVERQLYHLLGELADRADIDTLHKLLNHVALKYKPSLNLSEKKEKTPEYQLFKIVKLHLSKKRSPAEQKMFKQLTKSITAVLAHDCVARLHKLLVRI